MTADMMAVLVLHENWVGGGGSDGGLAQGEEFARENNSRPLLKVDYLLKIGLDGFSARASSPLKSVEDAGLL